MGSAQIEAQHEWLCLGAVEKANSIVELGSPYPPPGLAGFLSRAIGIPNLTVDCATLQESRFRDRQFDIGILSHVLEHVTEPAGLLIQLRRLCRIVIAEVPLEGTLAGAQGDHGQAPGQQPGRTHQLLFAR